MFPIKFHLDRPLRWLLASVLVLCAAGCDTTVVWLPDSSGFLYLAGGGFAEHRTQVVHYDIATQQKHVLLKNQKLCTCLTISPNGKYLAVGRAERNAGLYENRLLVLERATGKELHRSKVLSRLPVGTPYDILPFWSPGSDKLLLSILRPTKKKGEGVRQIGVYSWKLGQWVGKTHRGALFLTPRGPVRADGEAFLIFSQKQVLLGGWDGKVKLIGIKKEDFDDDLEWFSPPTWMFSSRWDKHIATCTKFNGLGIRVDTNNLTAKGIQSSDHFQAKDRRVRHWMGVDDKVQHILLDLYRFPKTKTLVGFSARVPDGAGLKFTLYVEVLKASANKPEVLWKSKLTYNAGCLFFPSPDQNLVAVRFPGRILLVNQKGEVTARIMPGKK